MGNVLGTIKILGDKIITKKEGITEVWIKNSNLGKNFIKYNNYYYTIESEVVYKNNLEDDSDDDMDWDDSY
jgi:hypothetical protein